MKPLLKSIAFLFFLSASPCMAQPGTPLSGMPADTLLLQPDPAQLSTAELPAHQERRKWRERLKDNKKVIAAVLAFPLPFGCFGAHRIYLGTKPYVPFVYIGTLGGCVFILPMIDFFTILFSDEETFGTYENNPRVIMWGK